MPKFRTQDIDLVTACLVAWQMRKPVTITYPDETGTTISPRGIVVAVARAPAEPLRSWDVTYLAVVAPAVSSYRAFVVDQNDTIVARHEFEAKDAAAALEFGRQYLNDRVEIQVWRRTTFIGSLNYAVKASVAPGALF